MISDNVYVTDGSGTYSSAVFTYYVDYVAVSHYNLTDNYCQAISALLLWGDRSDSNVTYIVTDSYFADNIMDDSATNYGAALHLWAYYSMMDNCQFYNNHASVYMPPQTEV